MPTAILLISEQTLPNVLFLKQFGPFDHHVFLTTGKMEEQERSSCIIQAAGINPNSVQRMALDPEDATTGLYTLEQQEWHNATGYFVHITGGTKMMALAAYTFFAGKPGYRIIYLPINAPHFLQLQPETKEIPLNVRVTLGEYLKAYGVAMQSNNSNWQNFTLQAEEVMEAIEGKGKLERIQSIKNWMLNENTEGLSANDRKFYTGEWFEIWTASQVQSLFAIPSDSIAVEAKLYRAKAIPRPYSYEYDVVFIFQNRLYTCECKYFHRHGLSYRKLKEELLKYATVVVQFGLNAKAFFAIGNKTTVIDSELAERCKLLRLPYPATQDMLTNPQAFKSFIEKL